MGQEEEDVPAEVSVHMMRILYPPSLTDCHDREYMKLKPKFFMHPRYLRNARTSGGGGDTRAEPLSRSMWEVDTRYIAQSW